MNRLSLDYLLLSAVLLAARATLTSSFVPSHRILRNNNQRTTTTTRIATLLLHYSSSTGSTSSSSAHNNNDNNDDTLLVDAKTRQLLGLKSPSVEHQPLWKTRIQLMKPISWAPLSLIVMCGAAASGNYHWIYNPFDTAAAAAADVNNNMMVGVADACKGLAAAVLAGPFSEGFAQTINDWYDRDIDAINEPYRPIPSGAISQGQVFQQLYVLFGGGILLASILDVLSYHSFPIILAITVFGYFVSYIYSAPPLKLKQNGLLGDLAIGLCYISLPWWCGQAVFFNSNEILPVDVILPVAYSLTALGPGIVNDFKSMQGDAEFGLTSVPLMVGIDAAKYLAAFIPDLVQLCIATYFHSIGETNTALALAGLLVPQLYFQFSLLFEDPIQNDMKYVAFSQPFLTLSVLVAALCVGRHDWTL